MTKVLVVCPYPHGRAPSQRFRFEQYLDLEGITFTQEAFWKSDEWPRIYESGSTKFKIISTIRGFWRRLKLLGQVRNYDKVFIHREATPIGPPWFEWAVAKVLRKPIVFDFDDAIWLPNSSKANEKLAGKLKFHGKTAKICSWASVVVAGNTFLADYARQNCKDVRIIPTTVDTVCHHNRDLYEKVGSKWFKKDSREAASYRLSADHLESQDPVPEDQSPPAKTTKVSHIAKPLEASDQEPVAGSRQPTANTNLPVIGWTGTHSTLKQLTPLFPLLQELHNEIPFRFLLIADIPPQSMPDFIEFRKWKKETEIEDLLEMDIGVMPLYNTDWERGKCGFKALQYQALGIPAVASDVGVNTTVVKNGLTGFICEEAPFVKDLKWKNNLRSLLTDANLTRDLGLAGRSHIQSNYSIISKREYYADFILA